MQIGVDSSFWIGKFAGIQHGFLILTEAELFANVGKPIEGLRSVVVIPTRFITFVANASASMSKSKSTCTSKNTSTNTSENTSANANTSENAGASANTSENAGANAN